MSKKLIIYQAYNTEEYIEDSLTPFLKRKDCYVVASNRHFAKFPRKQTDCTLDILEHLKLKYPNRFVGIDSKNSSVEHEHHAKNDALKLFTDWARDNIEAQNVDHVFIVDSDEFYSPEDIENIFDFVDNGPEKNSVWFSLALKNMVFDKNTYFKEPFAPPRIFKTSFSVDWTNPSGDFYLHSFFWDNDIAYGRQQDRQNSTGDIPLYSYKAFAHAFIPKEVAWIPHYTWLNDERSKHKVEYQNKHFGHCGFKWEDGNLKLNEEYYEKTGEKLPQIIEG